MEAMEKLLSVWVQDKCQHWVSLSWMPIQEKAERLQRREEETQQRIRGLIF